MKAQQSGFGRGGNFASHTMHHGACKRRSHVSQAVYNDLMTKQEAAALLDVSTRAIERYTEQGKLTPRYEKGRYGRVPVYDEAQVRRLKEELLSSRARRVATRERARRAPTVAFRVDPYHLEKLTEEGAKYGLSAGEYARQLVAEGLEQELQAEVLRLRAEVTDMRKRVAGCFRVSLSYLHDQLREMHQGKRPQTMTHEQIEAWVEHNILAPRHDRSS